MVKNPPAKVGDVGDRVQSLGWEYPLEKEIATHSSILTWEWGGGTTEQVAISSSRESSQHRDQTLSPGIPALTGGFFTTEPPGTLAVCVLMPDSTTHFSYLPSLRFSVTFSANGE